MNASTNAIIKQVESDIISTSKTLVNSQTNESDFSLPSKRFLIIYPGSLINKVHLLNHIRSIVEDKTITIDNYAIIYNYDKDNELMYTNAYIKLNKSFDISDRNIFTIEGISPLNIYRICHLRWNIEQLLSYFFTSDTEPYTNLEKNNDKIEPWNFNSWQRYLLDIIENEVHSRAFYWCWDSIGCTGKSSLRNYIASNYDNVLIIDTLGSLEELQKIYLDVGNNDIKIVIIDLGKEESNNLLTLENTGLSRFIENLKNESFIKPVFKRLFPCHVIVFAQCIVGIDKLSHDRWQIFKIIEDGKSYKGFVNEDYEIEYDPIYFDYTNESSDDLSDTTEDIKEIHETFKEEDESVGINIKPKELETNIIELLDTKIKSNNLITIIKELVNSKSSENVFRLSSMRILITYQGVMLDKEDLFAYFTQRITSTNRIINDYVIVHNKYEGSLNTHVYIKLNKTLYSNKSNVFDIKGVPASPNIERVCYKSWNIRPVISFLFECDTSPYTNLTRSDYINTVKILAKQEIVNFPW